MNNDIEVKIPPESIYYIESPTDNSVLIGINVTIESGKVEGRKAFLIKWYDTVRERRMIASEIIQRDNTFSFKRIEREGSGIYYFTPMNLDIYNKKVKDHLIAGPSFSNEQDMLKSIQSTIDNQF